MALARSPTTWLSSDRSTTSRIFLYSGIERSWKRMRGGANSANAPRPKSIWVGGRAGLPRQLRGQRGESCRRHSLGARARIDAGRANLLLAQDRLERVTQGLAPLREGGRDD